MIWPFKKKKPAEKRNLAMTELQYVGGGQPVYTNWTIKKAVAEGYKTNGWVFRCVSMISKSASSVPWYVYKDSERIDGHPLTLMLQKPNPNISRQDLFELIVLWLELAGNSYLKKVEASGKTAELWPVSPDRLHPITPKKIDEWCDGFALDDSRTATFQPDEIIHHKFINPDDPLLGISPLEVAGKAVDCDAAMQDFNVSTSQKRGVVDGVFTFGRSFSTQDESDAVSEKLSEKYGKKRGFIVLGSDAKYQRMALTPTEMDFNESRRFTREEICVIFGVPLPLISQESSTYNNFSTAELIFWTMTIIPLLDDICDTFNFSLSDELNEGEKIGFDLSNVPAIRTAMKSKLESAKLLSEMGVPFEQINRVFDIGIDEYDGWSESVEKKTQQNERQFRMIETRSNQSEFWADIDKMAEGRQGNKIKKLLSNWQQAVFSAMENEKSVEDAIYDHSEAWVDTLEEITVYAAVKMGRKLVIESREIEDPLTEGIKAIFESESFILTEYSLIEAETVDKIMEKIKVGLAEGLSIKDIQLSIIDSGIFSPERALRIARTEIGTAASYGQQKAAERSGAKEKIWDAGPGARKEHKQRDGEKVPINGRFSPKFGASTGPRFPCDPFIPAADRINCRCAMRFTTGGE